MNALKCSTIGCHHEATRQMSWRDPYYPELDEPTDRITDPVCDECFQSYSRRSALKVRDEGPVR